jgi:hypothetical protein
MARAPRNIAADAGSIPETVTETLTDAVVLGDGASAADAFADTQPTEPAAADTPAAEPEALPVDIAYAMDQREQRKSAHDAWCGRQIADGWAYGTVFSETARTDPSLVHYDLLPLDTQLAYGAVAEV